MGCLMNSQKRIALMGAVLAAAQGLLGCDKVACPLGTHEVGSRCTPLDAEDASTPESDAEIGSDGTSSSSAGVRGQDPASGDSRNGTGKGSMSSSSSNSQGGASGAASGGNASGDGAGSGSGAASGGGAGASGNNASGNGSGMSGMQGGACGSELCDNEDNDCDGKIDEAVTRPCGPMPEGICKQGVESCSAGAWSGECVGAVEAGMEQCDTEGLDENCNGTANEKCACTPGMQQPCGMMGGICVQGMQTCDADGQWSAACVGAVSPGTEVCDGVKDENCDGRVDENCECTNGETRECGVMGGECRQGKNTCANGKWGRTCEGEVKAGLEVCDSKDNDCDGRMDENVLNACGGCTTLTNRPGATCSAGMNDCRRNGQYVCQGTNATRCDAVARPAGRETCDGTDEDCDGKTDEGYENDCGGSCLSVLAGKPGTTCTAQCSGGSSRWTWGGFWRCNGRTQVRCEPCEVRCVTIPDENENQVESDWPNPCLLVDDNILTCVPKDPNCLPGL